jgi:hypothetical protein
MLRSKAEELRVSRTTETPPQPLLEAFQCRWKKPHIADFDSRI